MEGLRSTPLVIAVAVAVTWMLAAAGGEHPLLRPLDRAAPLQVSTSLLLLNCHHEAWSEASRSLVMCRIAYP
jgi:hypothetical protein